MPTPLEMAQAAQQDFARRAEAVRDDDDLSLDGQRRRLVRLYMQTRDRLAELRERHESGIAAERQRLYRKVFGTQEPAFATAAEQAAIRSSYRDALERADEVQDPAEALRLISRAERVGDKDLERAVATVAFERGWHGIAQQYAQQHGTTAESFDQLVAFEEGVGDLTRRFGDSMAFSISKPQEIHGMTQPEVDAALAEDAS